MAFKPIAHFEGKEVSLPMGSSATVTRHKLCKMSSGYLVVATAGDNEVEFLALETKTNSGASGAAFATVLPIDDAMKFEALTATTPVQATHVGTNVDLSDEATLDLTATTDKVFCIDSIKSAADKIVIGRFNKPALA